MSLSMPTEGVWRFFAAVELPVTATARAEHVTFSVRPDRLLERVQEPVLEFVGH